MIDMATNDVKFEHGQRIAGTDHRFAGTGAYGAYKCWEVNRDAIKAVKSAYSEDPLSGGNVKMLNLVTRHHNVSMANSAKAINSLTIKKGVVMYPPNQVKHVPVSEAMDTDPFVKQAATKAANGEVSAQAPAGNDKIVWTDADVQRLDQALNECFGKK